MTSQFENVDRDEATLGLSKSRKPGPPGLAEEDQPIQRPPETRPEPRPVEPTMSLPLNSSQSTNTILLPKALGTILS
jgi:hypothetical protein